MSHSDDIHDYLDAIGALPENASGECMCETCSLSRKPLSQLGDPSGQLGDTPIARLPQEILLRIFKAMAHDYAEAISWVRVSHVCSEWRALVLGAPILWSRITLRPWSSMHRIETWIVRSGQMPLSVEMLSMALPSVNRAVQLYNKVLTELPRIQRLKVVIPRKFFSDLVWPGLPAPHMRSLELIGQRYYAHNSMGDMRSDALAIFAQNFEANFPRVASLVASYYNFSFLQWKLPSTLTSLRISDMQDMHGSSNGSYHMSQLLSALDKLPQLRELELDRSLPPLTGSELPTVSLPHLEHLTLSGLSIPCGKLLEHLVLPKTATLSLELQVDANFSQVPKIVSGVTASVNMIGTFFSEVQLKDSQGHRRRDFVFTAWRDADPRKGISQHRPSQGDVRIGFSLQDGGYSDANPGSAAWIWDFTILETVFKDFPLEDTVTLDVYLVGGQGCVIDMPKTYEKMTKVEHLTVNVYINRPDVSHFTTLLGMSGDAGFLFPALRVMTVVGVTFADAREIYEGQNMKLLKMTVELREVLEARSGAGLGPTELVLRKCGALTRVDVDELSKFATVDWDEWVQPAY